MSQTKRCAKCTEIKPLDCFHIDRSKPDGRLPRCKLCKSAERRARYARNPKRELLQTREYKKKNIEKCKATKAIYFQKNKGEKREYGRKWRAKNLERARYLDREWARKNPEKNAARSAMARARRRNAAPPWLTRDMRDLMRALYKKAAEMPGDWHVDHIIPIRGNNVCGLHVPENLQILSAAENYRKNNRWQ